MNSKLRNICLLRKSFNDNISLLFHPILAPVYLALSVLFSNTLFAFLNIKLKIYILSLISLSTILVPLSLFVALKYIPVIRRNLLDNGNKEKILILFLVGVGYLVLMLISDIYISFSMPRSFFFGGAITVSAAILTRMFWKISLYMIGIGIVSGALFAISITALGNMTAILGVSFVITGVIATSRLSSGKHNLAQILAGYLLGFVIVFLSMSL